MEKASKILYTVGKVFNVIEIVMTSLTLVLGILITLFGESIVENVRMVTDSLNGIITVGTGTGFIIGGTIALIVSIVTLVLANNATKSLQNGQKDNAPHIVMIIIGVFGDIFYLLGGIFGLVAENSEHQYGNSY